MGGRAWFSKGGKEEEDPLDIQCLQCEKVMGTKLRSQLKEKFILAGAIGVRGCAKMWKSH